MRSRPNQRHRATKGRITALVMAASLLFVLPTTSAAAAPGDLDTTFGAGGKVVTDFGADSQSAFRVHVRPDGRLVVSGCTRCFPSNPLDTDFAAVQYNQDGSVDVGFGTAGVAIVDFGREDPLAASLLQPDGKVVLAGSSTEPHNPATRDWALTRLETDGRIDDSFGTDGKALTDIGADDQLNDVVLQPDGKIVAVGFTDIGGRKLAMARYNPEGTLDAAFGTAGTVITDVGGSDQILRAVALQDDGKIVAAGFDGSDVVVARYETDGGLDASFGSGGFVKTDIAGSGRDLGFAVNVLSTGKILVGGLGNNADFALLRYDSDGSLDKTFDGDGIVLTDFGFGEDIIYRLAELDTGHYLAVGEARTPGRDFGMALYNPDGTLDDSFGDAGLVTTTFGGATEVARDLALQADGTVVVVGVTIIDGDQDFAMAKYRLGGSPSCTMVGTSGNDVLIGTAGSDVICGRGGDDIIYGNEGNDILRGGAGDDRIFGGFGSDQIKGNQGDDVLVGGAQDDLIIGGPGDDVLRGKGGDDRLEGNRGDDALWGAGGDDQLLGGRGVDNCDGGGGTNALTGCE